MRPLIGVTTSELRPSGLATLRRQGEPDHPEMALGMTYLQRDRARRRGAGRAAAVRVGPRVADRPPRRRLPLRRPGPGPRGLRRRATATRSSGRPSRRWTPSSSRSRARRSSAGCRCWASAAARRRSTSPAAARCTSTSPGHRQSEPGCQVSHEVEVLRRHAPRRADRRRARSPSTPSTTRPSTASAAACGRRARRRRHRRGDRGPGLRARRPVARRDARRRAPVRGARERRRARPRIAA